MFAGTPRVVSIVFVAESMLKIAMGYENVPRLKLFPFCFTKKYMCGMGMPFGFSTDTSKA